MLSFKKKKVNEENLNTSGKYDEINFGRYLRLFLLQSKLILIITLTGLVVGLANYFTSTKTYQISRLDELLANLRINTEIHKN